MKRILLLLFISIGLFIPSLAGQTTKFNGMSYQAIARDAQGSIIANAPVAIKISFSIKKDGTKNYYTEIHQVTTDENGLINLVIGEGKETLGAFEDIPWDSEQVWLNVEMDVKGGNNFALVGSNELYAVPYAYHAATASELIEGTTIDLPTKKSQSIYWLTGGNDKTSPGEHFVGTVDSTDLVFKTNNVTRLVLTKQGQLQVKSGVTGSKKDKASYAVTIEDIKQGIYIKVKNGSDSTFIYKEVPDSTKPKIPDTRFKGGGLVYPTKRLKIFIGFKRSTANNFMTFADDENSWGGIEGQSLEELEGDPEYQREGNDYSINSVFLVGAGLGTAAKAYGYLGAGSATAATVIFGWSVPGWLAAAGGAFANVASFGIEAASVDIEHKLYQKETKESLGVTYSSGAGDYAEWLQRAPGVKALDFGEIVGVNGGKVSLDTKNAQHVMVVSKQPIVLGNAPQEKFKKDFEKIAFMGQVPVKVAGKVEVGDYIIPSGNNDGFGIAVNPKAMKIGDFAKIVGVAWQSAKERPFNLVNVAVGLKNNDLAPKVEELSTKIDNIIAYLEGKGSLRPQNAAAAQTQPQARETNGITHQLITDEEFDQFVDQHTGYFTDLYANVKLELIKRGLNMSDCPEINAFLDNPIPAMKQMRRNPSYSTQWGAVDRLIKRR
jgi:hypothetical protein